MIELRLTVDNVDYEELLDALIPHLVKNKFAERTLKTAISAKFASMTEAEKSAAATGFLCDNNKKITEIINVYIKEQRLGCHLSSFEAIEK